MKNEIFIRKERGKKINKKFAYVARKTAQKLKPELDDLFHPFIKWNSGKKILHEVVKKHRKLFLQCGFHFLQQFLSVRIYEQVHCGFFKWRKLKEKKNQVKKGKNYLDQLTNDSVVVVILNTHRDIFNTEVHLHLFNSEESSVIVFFLIRVCFEVNFAPNTFVFTPIVTLTLCFK